MHNRLLVASSNQGKIKEFKKLLGGIVDVMTPAELSLRGRDVVEGESYADNARMKAKAYRKVFDGMICGEDSGLEIDALGGRPGALSARYGGEELPHPEKCRLILAELKDVPMYSRTARFRATLVLLKGEEEVEEGGETEEGKGGEESSFEGVLEGWIGFEYRGQEGFGYDPIFIPQGFSRTNAELGMLVKNRISHRAKAIAKLAEYLKKTQNPA